MSPPDEDTQSQSKCPNALYKLKQWPFISEDDRLLWGTSGFYY